MDVFGVPARGVVRPNGGGGLLRFEPIGIPASDYRIQQRNPQLKILDAAEDWPILWHSLEWSNSKVSTWSSWWDFDFVRC